MKDIINVLSNEPGAIILLNAMSELASKPNDDFLGMFNLKPEDPSTCVVEVRVNGVLVPFMDSVNEALKQLVSDLDRAIEDRAVELISKKNGKLTRLLTALEDADYEIRDALKGVGITVET